MIDHETLAWLVVLGILVAFTAWVWYEGDDLFRWVSVGLTLLWLGTMLAFGGCHLRPDWFPIECHGLDAQARLVPDPDPAPETLRPPQRVSSAVVVPVVVVGVLIIVSVTLWSPTGRDREPRRARRRRARDYHVDATKTQRLGRYSWTPPLEGWTPHIGRGYRPDGRPVQRDSNDDMIPWHAWHEQATFSVDSRRWLIADLPNGQRFASPDGGDTWTEETEER